MTNQIRIETASPSSQFPGVYAIKAYSKAGNPLGIYIGESVQRIETRWAEHIATLANNTHPSSALQDLYDSNANLIFLPLENISGGTKEEAKTLTQQEERAFWLYCKNAGFKMINDDPLVAAQKQLKHREKNGQIEDQQKIQLQIQRIAHVQPKPFVDGGTYSNLMEFGPNLFDQEEVVAERKHDNWASVIPPEGIPNGRDSRGTSVWGWIKYPALSTFLCILFMGRGIPWMTAPRLTQNLGRGLTIFAVVLWLIPSLIMLLRKIIQLDQRPGKEYGYSIITTDVYQKVRQDGYVNPADAAANRFSGIAVSRSWPLSQRSNQVFSLYANSLAGQRAAAEASQKLAYAGY